MRMHTPYQDDQCATLFDPAERTMIGAKVVNNVLVNSMKGEFQKDYAEDVLGCSLASLLAGRLVKIMLHLLKILRNFIISK